MNSNVMKIPKIRKFFGLSVAVPTLLVGLVTGCQRSYQTEYEALSAEPAVYDEAMALREWERTPAFYASGNTIAGPTGPNREWRTGQANEHGYGRRTALATVADPTIYMINTLLLVPSVIVDPPFENREYEGRVLGPTYTAAVPFDAANAGSSYEGKQELRERVLKERQERRDEAARTPQRTRRGQRQTSPPRQPVPDSPSELAPPPSTRRFWLPLEDLVPATTRPGAAEQ